MGLFGGFKAKFTRNSKNKDNIQEVVCTKYHVFSEFDTPYNVNGIATSSNITPISQPRQHQVKPKRPLVKSEIFDNDVTIQPPVKKTTSLQNLNGTSKPVVIKESSPPPLPKSRPPTILIDEYEESNDRLLEKQLSHVEKDSPPIQKSRKNDIFLDDYDYEYPNDSDISFSKQLAVPSNSKSVVFSETSVDRNLTQYDDGEVEESFEIINNRFVHSSGNSYDSLFQTKRSVLTSNNYYEDMNVGDEPSTLILMTQHSLGEEPEQYPDKIQQYDYSSTYEDEEFKVNVVKHDKKVISFSEDEISNPDLADDDNDYRDLGYSSQASSIFFGGDLNPLASRTKTIALKGHQESDEEDC